MSPSTQVITRELIFCRYGYNALISLISESLEPLSTLGRKDWPNRHFSWPRFVACTEKLLAAGVEVDESQGMCMVIAMDRFTWLTYDYPAFDAFSLVEDVLIFAEPCSSTVGMGLSDLSDFLKRNGIDLLDMCSRSISMYVLYVPRVWPLIIALGLDPNSRSIFGTGDMETPIMTALDSLLMHKDNTRIAQIIIDSLALLIGRGADVYDVHWADERWHDEVEDGIMTPTAFVRATDGLLPLWETALRRAGLNPLEVLTEDARRRREFLRTHGATMNSVDVDLGQESSELRLRRPHTSGASDT